MQPRPAMFVDLDLPETCRTKAMIIRNKPELARVVFGNCHVDPSDSTPFIETKEYILYPMNLTDTQAMKLFLSSGKMDLSLPLRMRFDLHCSRKGEPHIAATAAILSQQLHCRV